METILSPTYLWVIRKNLTSIMKVLLVGFCGLLRFWLVQVKFGSCFSLMCFGFWLEISGENRQTCHFCRNRR